MMRRWVGVIGLCGVALTACGPLGGPGDDPHAVVPDKVKLEGALTPKDATPLDLHGLDKPTKLSGNCFSEYVVLPGGFDTTGAQRYILSFHLQGDPQDELALYAFLAKNKCGKQQAEVHGKVVKALGIVIDGTKPDPIDTSYRTTSGRRLFL